MRYLGMSMGIGIAIGITLIVGTLMTPIINGQFAVLMRTQGGQMTLLGVLVDVYKRQNRRIHFKETVTRNNSII